MENINKKIYISIALSLFFLLSTTSSGTFIDDTEETIASQNNIEMYLLMKLNQEILTSWQNQYEQAQLADIDPLLEPEIQTTSSYSILDLLDYIPSERDQGWCSNCWAWPATGVLGIALNVQEGIYDRLSVQYINSCGEEVGIGCCEGGNLFLFSNFYRSSGKAIPWSNDEANWQDKYARCRTECDSISKAPNYPIAQIYSKTIKTHRISEEEAIDNIKNVLHQQKGVYFSWILPDMDYREDFSNYWNTKDEDYIYDIDWDCGSEYTDTGGGHAVLCVGYNDDSGTDNDYWIMLNSWGTPSKRPNGLFAINMHMNYSCKVQYGSSDYYQFDWETLDVEFGTQEESPDPPTIEGPTSGNTNTVYKYTISALDNQNDDVYFFIDWADNTDSGWIGPYASQEKIEVSHTWRRADTYAIRVKAKDTNNEESQWTTLEVQMPKSKIYAYSLIDWLQAHFPLLENLFF